MTEIECVHGKSASEICDQCEQESGARTGSRTWRGVAAEEGAATHEGDKTLDDCKARGDKEAFVPLPAGRPIQVDTALKVEPRRNHISAPAWGDDELEVAALVLVAFERLPQGHRSRRRVLAYCSDRLLIADEREHRPPPIPAHDPRLDQ